MATSSNEEILEGFLCPICKADLKSASQLTSHFESLHSEEQDVLKSLKDIFGKAKKIILNNDDTDLKETFDRALKLNYQEHQYYYQEEQVIGVIRSSTDYFKAVRSARLERYATETNKLLIRLDKLVCNMPADPNQKKQHEQDVVPWLDGSSVKLCPSCAKSFSLTRRKHHCRLCGSILCHDCSVFLDLKVARSIVDPSAQQKPEPEDTNSEKNQLRLCEHCYNLIELRKQVQDSRNAKTVLMTAYEQMQSLMEQARPAVAMYEKMCQSLFEGETTYNLSDVNAMRGRVGKLAEGIDLLSKQIASLAAQPGREEKLHRSIRLAAENFIKDELISLRKLPTEAQIEEVRRQRYERAERQIELERRRMELERVTEPAGPSRPDLNPDHDDDSPLLEQMNIIRGYIKEARKELRFEEVAILEANLKELKKEYQLQKLSSQF
ncbi:rabenosyn-5 [Amyelois transitella]|uniref:rabenosyn-5 n=1 Tax=Amyelois transitella TaxID=680683 RepID=UPI0029901D18|nr:rabenosyn-5 [Amyelois transitella]